MDTLTMARRHQPTNKGNKENTRPPAGLKSFIKAGKTSVPLQLRGNKREGAVNEDGSLKAKGQQTDRKPVSGEAQRNLQRDAKGVSADIKGPTLKPSAAEAPRPSSRPAPGMYKGRIVQSKIGSIWKSSDTLSAAAPKHESQKAGDTAKKNRSKSVTEVSRQVPKRPVPIRSKSVSDKPQQVSRPGVGNVRPAGFCSARPPTRTATVSLRSVTSKISAVAPIKTSRDQNTKPKVPLTDRKASKPVVSSRLSQYRVATETAEEKRAKLAEWLASKGRTLKRPVMTAVVPPKSKVTTKVKADSKVHGNVVLQPCRAEPDPNPKVHKTPAPSTGAQREDIQSRSPGVINTTLDLLDDSEADLSPEPQGKVDDIVVNLCDALEAMVTSFRSSGDVDEQREQPDEFRNEDIQAEETREDQKVKQEAVKESEDGAEEVESSDDDVMETTPRTDASVIKYSVKTTPYLQSVKKTIDGEVSASRRKSNIKDLKFLTPVRRSNRIQQKSSHLPPMLADHDPCVSSLAELVRLDDDRNAYIYRKNPALLQELPDQSTF